jgi:hypothetical protein
MMKEQNGRFPAQVTSPNAVSKSGQRVVGLLLVVALLAFEMFNFDTTRYALSDFFGSTHFLGLRWAAILAVAFCAIDFAGLVRFFTPEREGSTPAEVWYLMGAWMLGATLNALMTWWAVSLTLLNHELGNEILDREQLLRIVPLFVAALVWLTRVLFIGAFTVAGEYLFGYSTQRPSQQPQSALPQRHPIYVQPASVVTDELPAFLQNKEPVPEERIPKPVREPVETTISMDRLPMPTRIQRRPTPAYARRR